MIPTLTFGRIGHVSTRTIFGTAVFWDTPQKEADAVMDLILQNSFRHMDTAASYGKAEEVPCGWIRPKELGVEGARASTASKMLSSEFKK